MLGRSLPPLLKPYRTYTTIGVLIALVYCDASTNTNLARTNTLRVSAARTSSKSPIKLLGHAALVRYST